MVDPAFGRGMVNPSFLLDPRQVKFVSLFPLFSEISESTDGRRCLKSRLLFFNEIFKNYNYIINHKAKIFRSILHTGVITDQIYYFKHKKILFLLLTLA